MNWAPGGKFSGVYRLVVGDRFYFGQTDDLRKRDRRHLADLRRGDHRNAFVQNTWNKHGFYWFEVIQHVHVDDLDRVEQKLLDRWVGQPQCMNVAKCAEAPARGRKATAEELQGRRGRKVSPEARARMSAARKGVPKSAAHRAALSVAKMGVPRSEAARAKLRASRIASHGRPVIILGLGIVFDSLSSCGRAFGVRGGSIRQAVAANRAYKGLFIGYLEKPQPQPVPQPQLAPALPPKK